MNIKTAIEILRLHNEWRRGNIDEQIHPKIIGEAIDCVVNGSDVSACGSLHIDFAVYLTGHDKGTIEQMYNDWRQ